MGYIISKGGNEWLKNLWEQIARKLGMDTGSFWGNGQMQLLPAGGWIGEENPSESTRGKQQPDLSDGTIFDRIYRAATSDSTKRNNRLDMEEQQKEDVQPENSQVTDAQPEESKKETVKTEESKEETVKTEESKEETVKTEESKEATVKTEESKEETVKTEESKEETVKAEESKEETVKTEESKEETVKTEERREEKKMGRDGMNQMGMNQMGMNQMGMEELDEPQMKPPEEPGFLYQLLTILTFGIWELTNKKNEKYKKYEKEQKAIEKAGKERSRRKMLQNARRQKAMERDYLRQMKMQQDMQAANTQPESKPTVNTQPESKPTVNTQPESKPEEKKETDIVSKNFNFAQDGGIQESPQAKSNMFQTMLKQEYELMIDNFGSLGSGWGEVKNHAGNILEMFRTMQKDPELKKTIEKKFSEASRKQLTGICQTLNYVGEKGEKAKELLLDKDRYEALSPQEKRACARDFVEMNILENMMTNHSMIQKRQEERGIVPGHRNASPRIPEFLMQIGKDPEKSKAMIDKFVDFVEITRAIENMSAEEREALVSSKASIQMRIAKDMKELKGHPPRKELLGDVPQNRKEKEKTEQKKGPEPLEKENSMEQPMLHQ